MAVPRVLSHYESKSWSGDGVAAAGASTNFRRASVRVRRQASPETSAFFNHAATCGNQPVAAPAPPDPAAFRSDEPTI